MEQNVIGKDLTKEAPRSPKTRVGDYVILGRTLDKCRALLAGNIGEYHFDCPLDNMLFGWKGIVGDEFKAALQKAKATKRSRDGSTAMARGRVKPRKSSGVKKCSSRASTTFRRSANSL